MIKPGLIYIMEISCENREWEHSGNLYKIGQTTNLKARLCNIRAKFGEKVTLIAQAHVNDKLDAEWRMHKKFWKYLCQNPMGIELMGYQEYFLFDEPTLNKAIVSLWGMARYYL